MLTTNILAIIAILKCLFFLTQGTATNKSLDKTLNRSNLDFFLLAQEWQCSKEKPCAVGCCSQFGSCGFGPEFCGQGCQGNCDAKADCGVHGSKFSCDSGCCGKDGFCGYTADFCGAGCQANCDAKPPVTQCGMYGNVTACPLNVCCSEWGWCGIGPGFCNEKCQNNCILKPPPTSCGSTMNRRLGYYESWAASRSCSPYPVSELPVADYTHLIFSFALVSSNYLLQPYNSVDVPMYFEFNGLKKNSKIKTMIAVGGWAHNDDYPEAFSRMAATPESRRTFIVSAIQFMRNYGFDGLDIDWEYPGADDRGGSPIDTPNYTKLLQELRAEFDNTPEKFLLSIAAPASFWYLRHFEVDQISKSVNWINVMTYDIHGTWDQGIESLGPYVNTHTNLTEVDDAIDLFIRAGAPPDKLNLGLGFYGRSFTLRDPSCTAPGCVFSGPSRAGSCSGSPGILNYKEIKDAIKRTGSQPVYYEQSASMVLTFDQDQWVGYDDERTLAQKVRYATNKCLGGAMVWAVDTDDMTTPGLMNAIRTSFPHPDVECDANRPCPNRECCSAWGKCGNNKSYCSAASGCQNNCVWKQGDVKICNSEGRWPDTLAGYTATIPCPGSTSGSLNRLCGINGWDQVQAVDGCSTSNELNNIISDCRR
ncbi:hypothetical protein K7432_008446 [Basidiobolus ranarum]|uniref:Chitinase n=1 Tax=Basidiobolus ranarum TaxID=34480 RepID=A0ABR2WRT2_9FUNG